MHRRRLSNGIADAEGARFDEALLACREQPDHWVVTNMNVNTLRAVALVVLTAGSGAFGQDLIEKVVVRNRLHTVKGEFEVTPSAGLTLVNRMTRHYNFNLGVGYNISETFAVELRGGYAVSGNTGLADEAGSKLLQVAPEPGGALRSDFTRLWAMKANGVLGVRWAPLYGKISLLAELPVHFQTYLWLGGGAAQVEQQSVIYCLEVESRTDGTCANWRTEKRDTWVGSAAVGFRFFTGQFGAIGLEVRNYLFPDKYLENIDRNVAESGGETGTEAPSPGFVNLVLFDLGYTFFF